MPARLEIKQPTTGYRYSIDPFLLADFITADKTGTIIDLGTGNGILILLLQKIFTDAKFFGIDIQHEPLAMAKSNCASRFNPILLQGDIRSSKNLFKNGSFDMAVSNPPYRKGSSGRINPLPEKAIARHEIKLTLEELISSAYYLLKDGGLFYLVHLAERSSEAIHMLNKHAFAPSVIRFVHSKPDMDAFLVLVCAVKNGKNPVTVKPPLTVYGADGEYSGEMNRIYGRFDI